MRLVAAVVQVAGGDAIHQQPRRNAEAVLDTVPNLRGGGSGQAEVVHLGQRASRPGKAGQLGRVQTFAHRRTANQHQVARTAVAIADLFPVDIGVVGLPNLTLRSDQRIDDGQTQQKADDNVIAASAGPPGVLASFPGHTPPLWAGHPILQVSLSLIGEAP